MLTPLAKELKKSLYLAVEIPSINGSLVQSVGTAECLSKGMQKRLDTVDMQGSLQ
jgi:hypothetical protein